MILLNDPGYVAEQYRDHRNLDARIALHARFSIAQRNFYDWVFDHLDLDNNARILELGCGTGLLWAETRARIPTTWQIALSDFSLGMLQTARAANLPMQFLQSDAQSIPFRDGSFDAMVANHMLYHIPDLSRTMSEVRRTLRVGGKLYATTNGERHMSELSALAAELGLEETHVDLEFSLENGEQTLSKFFRRVERFYFEDGLWVTEIQPLVDYVASGRRYQSLVSDETLNAFRSKVEARIASDGGFRITKSQGLYVATE